MKRVTNILLLALVLGIPGLAYASGVVSVGPSTLADTALLNNLTSQESALAITSGYSPVISAFDGASGDTYKIDTIVIWNGGTTPQSSGFEIYITRPSDGAELATGTGLSNLLLSHDWQIPTASTTQSIIN